VLAEADGTVTALDSDGLDAFLDLWLARRAAVDPDAPPLHLVAYGVPGILAEFDRTWEKIRPRVESLGLRNLTDGVLPRLASQIATTPGINLLQGEFARRTNLVALTPAWRVAAALLLGLSLLAFGVQVVELRKLQTEVAGLDADIDQAFHYVFPDAGPIGDARGELSTRLQELGERSAGGGHEFLDTLRIIAQAVSGNRAARVEAINYRAGTMELRVRAANVETLDRIQQFVTQTGTLKAQIQSANASGNEVIGRLQITRAGS
jgi:type II secretion system protein L